jgi:hypothetical protein
MKLALNEDGEMVVTKRSYGASANKNFVFFASLLPPMIIQDMVEYFHKFNLSNTIESLQR